LVGTVAQEQGGIGVFLDAADKSVVRLKAGENHKGWTLRDVGRRAVVLTKGFTVVELALPTPDLTRRDAAQSGLAAQPFGIPVAQPGQTAQTGEAGLKGPASPPAAAIAPPAPGGIAGSSTSGFGAFALPAVRH
jgi:general secretion pathway protein N